MSKLKGVTDNITQRNNLRELKTNKRLQRMTKQELIREIKTNNMMIGQLRATSINRLAQIRSMRVHLKGVHDRIERILKSPYIK